MQKTRNAIPTKALVTGLVLVLLYFLFRSAFLYVSIKASEARENEMMELKMSTMLDIVSDLNEKRAAADTMVSENLKARVGMMSNLLQEFVTEAGYEGPRVFADGVVAELRDGRVLFPEDYRGFESQVTREQIMESLQSGAMMSRLVTADEDMRRSLAASGAEEYANGAASESYFLSFGEIAPGIFYVDLMSEQEYNACLNRCTQFVYEALEAANVSFGGITLALRENDGEIEIFRQYGTALSFETPAAGDLLREMLGGHQTTVTLDGQDYSCAYASFEARQNEEGKLIVVQLIPKVSLQEDSIPRMRLLRLVMEIILIVITVYTIAVQHAMATDELSEELRNRYRPKRLRRRMVTTGVLSVVVVFAAVILVEAVGLMYSELRSGRDILNLFSGQLERNNEEQVRRIEREEEEWIVFYGEKLAPLLNAYPVLNTPQKLRETCEILGVETIMEFDARGRQTLCSGDYTGFRLDDEEHPSLYDFRRLLYGVPSVIHAVETDPITGLERQQIGVTMPVQEHAPMHGALIMTLRPERIGETAKAFDAKNAHPLSSASGTICFAADSADGTILYSTKPVMTGKLVSECGLPEDSLRDGFMDFAILSGADYLLITSREGERVYYYAAGTGTVFGRILQIGAAISLIFAAALALLLLILLGGYNEEVYREWESLRGKEQDKLRQLRTKNQDKLDSDVDNARKKNFLQNVLSVFGWDQKDPGEKAALILHIGLILFILCVLDTLHGKLLPNESYGNMLGFFLNGGWRRGLNLFSLCSVLLIIGIAYLINIVCSLLLRLTGGVVSENGETIIRLLYSCVRYITVIAVIYFSLEYLGFSAATIIASLGIVSLALSLGAQDLIADVLAGLAIVFDRSFRIGDVVKIGDTEGVVREIGVRSTKLTVEGNHTLVINNHEIRSILNKSKELSEIELELRIPASESLLRIEALLNRALPEIGSRNSKIVEGPHLLGVTGLSGSELKSNGKLIQLSIEVIMNQKDAAEVMAYLMREIRLLCEREGIELL